MDGNAEYGCWSWKEFNYSSEGSSPNEILEPKFGSGFNVSDMFISG